MFLLATKHVCVCFFARSDTLYALFTIASVIMGATTMTQDVTTAGPALLFHAVAARPSWSPAPESRDLESYAKHKNFKLLFTFTFFTFRSLSVNASLLDSDRRQDSGGDSSDRRRS